MHLTGNTKRKKETKKEKKSKKIQAMKTKNEACKTEKIHSHRRASIYTTRLCERILLRPNLESVPTASQCAPTPHTQHCARKVACDAQSSGSTSSRSSSGSSSSNGSSSSTAASTTSIGSALPPFPSTPPPPAPTPEQQIQQCLPSFGKLVSLRRFYRGVSQLPIPNRFQLKQVFALRRHSSASWVQ